MSLLLDLVKTLAAVAVPVVVAVLGYRLNQRLKLWEATQWRNQELIKARLRYYDQLAPMVNDLMCYLTYIGRWKDLAPPDVIQLKRDADRLFLSVAPLFSQRAVGTYQEFIRACFEDYTGPGLDARIRSGFEPRREATPDWRPEWQQLFLEQEDPARVRTSYDGLLRALAEDIELSTPRERYVVTRFAAGPAPAPTPPPAPPTP